MFLILYLSLIVSVSITNGLPYPLEDECNCFNGGECIQLISGEKGCSCKSGFSGKNCELIQGRSSLYRNSYDNLDGSDYKIQCLNNGTVYYDKNGKLKCKCKPNLTGAKCEFMIPSSTSECTPNPCFNGGFCADLYPGFRCTCPPAYNGLLCEKIINESPSNCAKPCDPCAQNPCSSNGKCLNYSCNALCVCNPMYTGTFCNELVTMEPTTTTTTCSPVTTTTTCSVPTTTTATTAFAPCYQTQCDPCAQNPCTKNGLCHNYSCTAYCECDVGYTGDFCETLIPLPEISTTTQSSQCNVCPATNACSNHGECFTLSCEAYCVCDLGYTGENCEVLLQEPSTTTTPCPETCDPCSTKNPCTSNGQCTNVNCTAFCVCNTGYTGTYCEVLLQTPAATTTPCPAVTQTTMNSVSAIVPILLSRCNFSIGLFNDGAFTTRFKVEYKIDGITQPILTSRSLSIIGQSTFNTIPYYSTDIIVTVEVLGWNWFTVKEDTGISTATYCTKCYKTWGTVTGVKIDHLKC